VGFARKTLRKLALPNTGLLPVYAVIRNQARKNLFTMYLAPHARTEDVPRCGALGLLQNPASQGENRRICSWNIR